MCSLDIIVHKTINCVEHEIINFLANAVELNDKLESLIFDFGIGVWDLIGWGGGGGGAIIFRSNPKSMPGSKNVAHGGGGGWGLVEHTLSLTMLSNPVLG